MKNPYEHLHIYNFDGIPVNDPGLGRCKNYLGTWEEDGTAFVFFNAPEDGLVADLCAANPEIKLVDHYEMDSDTWHGDRIEPYQVESLTIAPPWNLPKGDDNAQANGWKEDGSLVLMDPGVVFGTGRHQTTEDCLTLIQRIMKKHRVDRVVDIGTGTGLLALGAAALGCSQVLALDFNALAVKTCLNNIRLNRFEEQILAFQARGEQMVDIPCDLFVANIHYDVMQHIIAHPEFVKKPWFILSGLLNSEAKKVMALLRTLPVHVMERRCIDGIWNTILGRGAVSEE